MFLHNHNILSKNSYLKNDLDHILANTSDLWEAFRNQHIFITGGTGFFGTWLLESFAWANDVLNLNSSALVLSRNPDAFTKKAPHLCIRNDIKFLKGNITDFLFPDCPLTYLIHCAVYQPQTNGKISNVAMAAEMIEGTKRILDLCIKAGVKKLLLVSTGAIYGNSPFNSQNISEDYPAISDPSNKAEAYQQIRRIMETLSVIHADEHNFEVMIARCFSFIGPYMPLNGRFAVDDFIRDTLSRNSLRIKGNGKTVRSYLYAADLAIWLWKILLQGKSSRPYNVGSEIPVTILELANLFARETKPALKIEIAGRPNSGIVSDHYVPDTSRAKSELKLKQTISLDDAVKKTMRWYNEYYSGKELYYG